MTHIIPAILEQTIEDIQKKVQRIKPYTNFVQLDVMDGLFVPNATFNEPSPIADLDIELEIHLMIERPSLFFHKWALPNVRRLIVHYEAMDNVKHEIELMKKTDKEVAIALNPDTSTYEIKEHLDALDMVVIMGVQPGFSGQEFHKDVLEKIKEIKKWRPDILVEVDGGVNEFTRDRIVNAGADLLASASYIWESEDIGKAIACLEGKE